MVMVQTVDLAWNKTWGLFLLVSMGLRWISALISFGNKPGNTIDPVRVSAAPEQFFQSSESSSFSTSDVTPIIMNGCNNYIKLPTGIS
jgi:hypothetical protein